MIFGPKFGSAGSKIRDRIRARFGALFGAIFGTIFGAVFGTIFGTIFGVNASRVAIHDGIRRYVVAMVDARVRFGWSTRRKNLPCFTVRPKAPMAAWYSPVPAGAVIPTGSMSVPVGG